MKQNEIKKLVLYNPITTCKNPNLPPFSLSLQTNVTFLQEEWRHGIMSTDPSPIAYLAWIHGAGVAIAGRRR